MVIVQLVHGIEEYYFEFWNVFPPMRYVYGGVPGLGHRVFVLFHALLVIFGVWCYFRWVRHGGKDAFAAVNAWIWIQGVTVAVHVAWFIVAPAYRPGLATVPLFLPTMAFAIAALKRARSSSMG
jgi:hypothetical protein